MCFFLPAASSEKKTEMQNLFSFLGSSAHCLSSLNEVLSFRNLCLAFPAAFTAYKLYRYFFPRRRREPVQWFIGDTESPIIIAAGENDAKEGLVLYPNGDSYKGEFHLGKCSGSGVYTFCEQRRYEGDWVDGKFDGYGIERMAQGSRYHGHFHRGLHHGFGVFQCFGGCYYAGEWVGGRSHGNGLLGCPDGSYYVGEFKSGVKHGSGFYQFSNGDYFAGEYFCGVINGFGVYHFAKGDCYQGSWHEGMRQGFGVYTFKDGEALSGEWSYGTLKVPLPLSHPKVQRSVECGRNAVKSSYGLSCVEEKVNHAVVEAIRAATAARVAAIRTCNASHFTPII